MHDGKLTLVIHTKFLVLIVQGMELNDRLMSA